MAEVVAILGLIGSIIGIIEGVNKTTVAFKKYVHKSSSLQRELIPILGKLSAFTGILRGLQLECELEEFDGGRQKIMEHIRAPLEASEKAAKIIVARLNQVISVGGISLAFGKVVNKETAAALHILEQSKNVLDLALDVDQRTLLKAIEQYLRIVAEDLYDMHEQGKLHYKDLKDDIQNIRSNDEEARRIKMKAELLSWVSQVNYSSNFDAAHLRTYENDQSGDWFLKGREFSDWCEAASRSGLLVTGISGAGKTILCCKAIFHVLQNQSLSDKKNIIYFFFDFNDIAKQSIEGMVRSLIYQLVAKADDVADCVQKFYAKHLSAASIESPPRLEEWEGVLCTLLRDTERPFVFIDALDECIESERQDLLQTIQSMFNNGGPHIKVLLTARPQPSSAPSHFLNQCGFILLSMHAGDVNRDIKLHLKARLENDTKLSSFGLKQKEMIISGIVSKSAGMFRYAECQLSALAKLKDRRVNKVREILDKMPETLQSTYSKILHELRESDEWPILERTLVLVSYCARPVTVMEVAEFAVLEDEMTSMQVEERFEDFGDILSMISNLIDVQDGYLTLAHQSVQDFLNSLPEPIESLRASVLYQGADLYIAKRCFQYLSFPQPPACESREYRDVKNRNAKYLTRLLADYPFLDYAASRWTHHIRSADVRALLLKEMQSTLPLTVVPNLWKAWLLLQRADIWETRLKLARVLCEVSIRCSQQIPGWACGFWKLRQAYRFTTNMQETTGSLDEMPSPTASQAGLSSTPQVLNEIRGKASKLSYKGRSKVLTNHAKPYHDLAVVLLEVALQTSLYGDLDLLLTHVKSEGHLDSYLMDMLALSNYAATIMGKEYSTVVTECLLLVTSDEDPRALHLLEVQEEAMETFHDPLQSMLKSGFRASRGRVNANRRLNMEVVLRSAQQAPLSVLGPGSVRPFLSGHAYYNTSTSTVGYGPSHLTPSVHGYKVTSTSSWGQETTPAKPNRPFGALISLWSKRSTKPQTRSAFA